MSGEDTFPFLKQALGRAEEKHNVLVITSSKVSAWLFTCILQKMREAPTPIVEWSKVQGYQLDICPPTPGRRVSGSIILLPRKFARKRFTPGEWNVSDVWTEDGTRMSLEDWQEKEGLIRKRPADRFTRMVDVDTPLEKRGKGLRDFPRNAWLEVERDGYKRKVIVQVVSRTFYFDMEWVRDASGREFQIYHRDVLSVVRVPRPRKVV